MEQEQEIKPRIIKNRPLRLVLLVLGFIMAFLAMLGALLPLLPTTPFLIASAACFYRSSEKFYNLIMFNPYFGHYLRDYKAGKGIPMHVKILSMSFLWTSTLVSVIFFITAIWLQVLVIAFTTAVTVHVFMIRTKRPE